MKANKSVEMALVNILNGIYKEIHSIESALGIRGEEGDFRPRIEYFHDAVRALTSGDMRNKRLSVEFLSYDVAMLRYIQNNPLTKSKGKKLDLSPRTALVTEAEAEYASGDRREVRAQLSELYKSYSVLFVALFADPADRDYQSKVNTCNEEVENIAAVERAAKAAGKNQQSAIDMEDILQELDDPALIQKILAAMGGNRKKVIMAEALQKLSAMIKAADKQIKTVEQAHFTYATSQLAIYENARDVVKKMAVSGMNIVGNFVEAAVYEANKGGSRGM